MVGVGSGGDKMLEGGGEGPTDQVHVPSFSVEQEFYKLTVDVVSTTIVGPRVVLCLLQFNPLNSCQIIFLMNVSIPVLNLFLYYPHIMES